MMIIEYIPSFAGILLCFGALMTMLGRIYWAVSIYLIADICWFYLAVSNEDVSGMVFIGIGTILGFLAFLKMRLGIMEKRLEHE